VVRTPGLALAHTERRTVDAILVDLRGSWWSSPEMRALRSLSCVPVYAFTAPNEMPERQPR